MRKLMTVVLLVVFLTTLIGVAPTGAQQPVKTSGFTFGGLGKVVHPYWDEVANGVKNAATIAKSTAAFENPSKEDVARQVTVLEGYVAQNVDGIVFGASDPGAFDKVVKDAIGKKIPVVTFDSDAPTSGRLLYIGPNSYTGGFLAGQRMAKILNGAGKVAIQVGSLTALNAKQRIQGFKDAIKDTKIQIVAEDVDQEDAQVANAHSEAILAANPDLAGMYGVYGYSGPAQARALQAAGKKPGDVKVVCFDPLDETTQFIQQGYIDSAVDNRQYNFGFFATMILWNMKVYGVDNTLTMLGFDPKKDPKDNILYTPTFVVTKDDLAPYKAWHDTIKTPPAPAAKTEGFTFGGLGKVVHPYWDEVASGVKNAAMVANSTAAFENPSKEDVARQVTVLEGYVAQNVDGIVFGASDPGAFDKVVKDAIAKKIPVVTFDSDAPTSGRLLYIGPNSTTGGTLAGQRMAKILNGAGKVAIQVGSLTALNAKQRIQGFKDAIKDTKIQVVAEDVDQEDAQVANAHSEAILAANPDLAGMYGVYGYSGPAQARALQAAGKKPGDVKVVCFDPLDETTQFIQQGFIDSAVDNRQYNFGFFATMILWNMKVYGVDNTLTMLGFDPKKDPKDNILYTPTFVVTKDDLAAYKVWHDTIKTK